MALHLEIVTPERKVFDDAVENVYLPATEGEMGVLDLHVPLVTPLSPGELRYSKDGQVHELAVGDGFIEVTSHKVIVLTDLAVADVDIDEDAVEKAMKRAEEALSKAEHMDHEEMATLQASIAKSMAQLKLKRKRRNI